jgi:peptide/nickel transport system permease protein
MTPRKALPLSLVIGGLLCLAFLAMAVLSFFYTPYQAEAINIDERFASAFGAHLFGTDQLGRDILSMIMVGARTSLLVATIAISVGLMAGIPIGLAAASGPRWLDQLLMRCSDIIFAFPVLVLAVLFTSVGGPSAVHAILAVALFNIPVFAQLTRGSAISLWQKDFILAAQITGKSRARISLEHILPNMAASLIVQATIQFSFAIGAEAALSFIGLGAPPPIPSWGRMLADAQTMFGWAPGMSLFPGLAITLSVLGFSLFGDGLRDYLDPKLLGREQEP